MQAGRKICACPIRKQMRNCSLFEPHKGWRRHLSQLQERCFQGTFCGQSGAAVMWTSREPALRPPLPRLTAAPITGIKLWQSCGRSQGFPRCRLVLERAQLYPVSGLGFPRSREKGPTASQIGALLRVRGLLATHRGTCRSSPPAHPCIAGALAAQAQWKSSMADNDGSLVYLLKSVP